MNYKKSLIICMIIAINTIYLLASSTQSVENTYDSKGRPNVKRRVVTFQTGQKMIQHFKTIDNKRHETSRINILPNKEMILIVYHPNLDDPKIYNWNDIRYQYTHDGLRKSKYSRKECAAWHEAGHAVSLMLQKNPANKIKYASISIANGQCPYIDYTTPLFPPSLFVANLKPKIQFDLAGGIAEQLYRSEDMIIEDLSIRIFFYEQPTFSDIKNLISYLTKHDKILKDSIPNYNKDTLISEYYREHYKYLNENKDYIKSIADALLEKQTLTGDEIKQIMDKMHTSKLIQQWTEYYERSYNSMLAFLSFTKPIMDTDKEKIIQINKMCLQQNAIDSHDTKNRNELKKLTSKSLTFKPIIIGKGTIEQSPLSIDLKTLNSSQPIRKASTKTKCLNFKPNFRYRY